MSSEYNFIQNVMNTNEFTQQKIEELLEQEFQEIKGGGSDNGDQES